LSLAAGQTIGRYRIVSEIGAGGMGVVYRAVDEKLERELAIKVLSPGVLLDESARRRFRHEAKILSRLNHPSIQTIHDFDSIDGHDLLVSELVPGVSLDKRVLDGPVPEKELISLGVQLAQGLAAAHAEGVLHRDLKPANLRVTPDGRLKILDFGLARLTRPDGAAADGTTDASRDAAGSTFGTPGYMAPEQLRSEVVDPRTDLFNLGAVLYEMLAADPPFRGTSRSELSRAILNDDPVEQLEASGRVDSGLARLLRRCLEKNPDERIQSAQDLAFDLEAFLLPRVPNRRPRHTRASGALALVVIGLLLASFVAGGRRVGSLICGRVGSVAWLRLELGRMSRHVGANAACRGRAS
jgi:serine/threonine protein kinase